MRPSLYFVKIAVWRLNFYTYLCKLVDYCFWLLDSIFGLSLSLSREGIILDAYLGWWLVFNNDITAQKIYDRMHIWLNFANKEESKVAIIFWEVKVKKEYGNWKRLSGCKSEIKNKASGVGREKVIKKIEELEDHGR